MAHAPWRSGCRITHVCGGPGAATAAPCPARWVHMHTPQLTAIYRNGQRESRAKRIWKLESGWGGSSIHHKPIRKRWGAPVRARDHGARRYCRRLGYAVAAPRGPCAGAPPIAASRDGRDGGGSLSASRQPSAHPRAYLSLAVSRGGACGLRVRSLTRRSSHSVASGSSYRRRRRRVAVAPPSRRPRAASSHHLSIPRGRCEGARGRARSASTPATHAQPRPGR